MLMSFLATEGTQNAHARDWNASFITQLHMLQDRRNASKTPFWNANALMLGEIRNAQVETLCEYVFIPRYVCAESRDWKRERRKNANACFDT